MDILFRVLTLTGTPVVRLPILANGCLLLNILSALLDLGSELSFCLLISAINWFAVAFSNLPEKTVIEKWEGLLSSWSCPFLLLLDPFSQENYTAFLHLTVITSLHSLHYTFLYNAAYWDGYQVWYKLFPLLPLSSL